MFPIFAMLRLLLLLLSFPETGLYVEDVRPRLNFVGKAKALQTPLILAIL